MTLASVTTACCALTFTTMSVTVAMLMTAPEARSASRNSGMPGFGMTSPLYVGAGLAFVGALLALVLLRITRVPAEAAQPAP